ncbi:hypothetical protein [Luteimonas mephitis]|uniref:hypothetical protein n=1 Tax=Luteimonas mephitis TaxID=83615 RepID=UPI003A9159DB
MAAMVSAAESSERSRFCATCLIGIGLPRRDAKAVRTGDADYAWFAERLIRYRDGILEPALQKKATPRRIDMELQSYAWQHTRYLAAFRERRDRSISKLDIPREPPPHKGIIIPSSA